jgi:hypothetical protein
MHAHWCALAAPWAAHLVASWLRARYVLSGDVEVTERPGAGWCRRSACLNCDIVQVKQRGTAAASSPSWSLSAYVRSGTQGVVE